MGSREASRHRCWRWLIPRELWETGFALEHLGDRAAVRPLIGGLHDSNPDRRHGAARALGWIPHAGNRAAAALSQTLLDKSQPQLVRETAAESLAYQGSARAIPGLISVLDEPNVRIRFWAVFALGGVGQRLRYRRTPEAADPDVAKALEKMLVDNEVAPGWWSVGREALAMLGHFEPSYGGKLDLETERVLRDPNSSAEDRRWAQGYSR